MLHGVIQWSYRSCTDSILNNERVTLLCIVIVFYSIVTVLTYGVFEIAEGVMTTLEGGISSGCESKPVLRQNKKVLNIPTNDDALAWVGNYLDNYMHDKDGACLKKFLSIHSGKKNQFLSYRDIGADSFADLVKFLPTALGGDKLIARITNSWRQKKRRLEKSSVSFELTREAINQLRSICTNGRTSKQQVIEGLILGVYQEEKDKRDQEALSRKKALSKNKAEREEIESYIKKYESYNFKGTVLGALELVDTLQAKLDDTSKALDIAEGKLENRDH